MDTRRMLTNDELQRSLKNEKEFINNIIEKHQNIAKEGIDGILRKDIESILNQVLSITYEIMKKMKKEDPLFKIMFLEHEKIYCFMLKNKLNVGVRWEDDDFLKSISYPLKDMEF